MTLSGYGIGIDLPAGWDGTIYRRADAYPVLHAASFPLPVGDGDFGTHAIGATPPGGVFIAMLQYDPALAGTGLFGVQGLPIPIEASEVSPKAFARPLPGLVAAQKFFTEAGRPFCLYVVLGLRAPAAPAAGSPLDRANRVLATVVIDPRIAP